MDPHLDLIASAQAVTLPGLFQARTRRTPEAVAYRQYDRAAQRWRDYTWRTVLGLVARWQRALESEALAAGDRVAVLLKNSVEWVCFDQAALSLGLVTVPLYTMDNPENVAYILADSGSRLLLVGTAKQWRALAPHRAQFPGLEYVIALDSEEQLELPPDIRYRTVAEWLPDDASEFAVRINDPHALASIVYTSGTTGRPKGVMLTHHNILWDTEAVMQAVPAYPEDVFLSFLPLSHTFERTAGYYAPMMAGSCIAYARSIAELREDLLTVSPTVLISVPRIYEKVYARIQKQLHEKGILAQRLFGWAVEVGWRRFELAQGRGTISDRILAVFWPLFRHLVAAKILSRLGGRLRLAISGGAALHENIARCFIGLGLPLLQGYGLTEAAPVVSGNRPSDNVPRSVGPPLPGVEVRCGDQNELLVRSPGVMRGYWNQSEATAAAIDDAGWLHTGDIAEIEAGRIFIRGRIKELIVTSTGEKVPPVDVEMAVMQDPLFDQIMIIGEGRPYLAAIVILEPAAWRALAAEHGLQPEDPAALADAHAKRAVVTRMAALLRTFPSYARPRTVHLSLEPWTIENGLITPTMKLKRPQLLQKYADVIAGLYQDHV